MGIEVATVGEDHRPIRQLSDTRSVVSRLATRRWPKLTQTVCLRFVDPAGDAVFNQAQIAELLSELRSEVLAAADEGTKEHLLSVIQLVETAQSKPHVYVKFMGD